MAEEGIRFFNGEELTYPPSINMRHQTARTDTTPTPLTDCSVAAFFCKSPSESISF